MYQSLENATYFQRMNFMVHEFYLDFWKRIKERWDGGSCCLISSPAAFPSPRFQLMRVTLLCSRSSEQAGAEGGFLPLTLLESPFCPTLSTHKHQQLGHELGKDVRVLPFHKAHPIEPTRPETVSGLETRTKPDAPRRFSLRHRERRGSLEVRLSSGPDEWTLYFLVSFSILCREDKMDDLTLDSCSLYRTSLHRSRKPCATGQAGTAQTAGTWQ